MEYATALEKDIAFQTLLIEEDSGISVMMGSTVPAVCC